METFVHDGVEVKKTGRTAARTINVTPHTSTTSVLVEITPVDEDLDWKKWVDPRSLYIIKPAEFPEIYNNRLL